MAAATAPAEQSTYSVSIRRACPNDMPAIAEFIGLLDERQHSSNEIASAVDSLRPESYLAWLAFNSLEPIGSVMLELRNLSWSGKAIRAGYMMNLFVRPNYRRLNIYPLLVLKLFKDSEDLGLDVIYSAPRRRRIVAGHMALGMKKICDQPVLAKPVRPCRLLARHLGLPLAVGALTSLPDAVFRVAARRLGGLTSSASPVERLRWGTVEAEDLAALASRVNGARLQQRRDLSFLSRRYRENLDREPYILVGARRAGHVVAAVAYRIAERHYVRAAVIMDVFHDPSDLSTVWHCLEEVERQASQQDADVILCLSDLNTSKALNLTRLGYMRSPETYTLLWRNLRSEPIHRAVPDASDLCFSFADHDAF